MSPWSSLTSGNAYKSPAFIALVSALCVAILLLLHHCAVITCCHRGTGSDRDRRRRRQQPHRRRVANSSADPNQQEHDDDDGGEEEDEVSGSATSRTHLVAAAVVLRYREEEASAWKETTCAVCLADFADGEAVRVLPECMHYFHADCIDTWLRGGSNSCPMCRAETGTPTPTRTPTSGNQLGSAAVHLEVSVSLEEILVRS